ncbi:MAG: hypothetical protein HC869_10090 [Rhodospirillales bacterium]|nr:hypothetical protein [Rhodospirillales bacterium]
MVGIDQKKHYKHYEIDFGRRLVAKFKIEPRSFWRLSPDFPQVSKAALYPEDDPLLRMTRHIRKELDQVL